MVASRLLYLGLIPALAPIVLVLASGRRTRVAGFAAAAGLAAGLVAAMIGLMGRPPLPPAESWQWLAYLAPATVLAGALSAPQRLIRLITLVFTAAAWASLTVPAWFESPWAGRIVLVLAIGVLAGALQELSSRLPAPILLVAAAIASAGAAVVCAGSANARLAELCGATAGAIAGVLLVTTFRRTPIETLLTTWAAALCAIVFSAYANNYGDVPTASFVLVLVAPLLAAIGLLPRLARAKPWVRGAAALVPVLLAVAGASGLSMAGGMEPYAL